MPLKPYWPAILWTLVITYLSVSPGVQLPKIQLISADKIGHAAAYALLTGLLIWGLVRAQKRPAQNRALWIMGCIAAGYGALMEWVQGTFFPHRFFEYDDMLANAVGACFAVLVYIWWRK